MILGQEIKSSKNKLLEFIFLKKVASLFPNFFYDHHMEAKLAILIKKNDKSSYKFYLFYVN